MQAAPRDCSQVAGLLLSACSYLTNEIVRFYAELFDAGRPKRRTAGWESCACPSFTFLVPACPGQVPTALSSESFVGAFAGAVRGITGIVDKCARFLAGGALFGWSVGFEGVTAF